MPCAQLVQAQEPTPDPRFGVVQTFDDFEAADELGVGFTRIKFYWDTFQPNSPDEWQPANIPDPLITTDLASGRQVVGLIVRTPAWARDRSHPAYNPNQPNSKDVPDMQAWGDFVERLVTQYQDRIQHWIIWNEPDVWDTAHPGNTWHGSEPEFVELHKTAYLAIKKADPQAKVYLTGLTYFWDYEYHQPQYLGRLLSIILNDPHAESNNFYLDGIIYHLYYKPQMNYDILSQIQFMLDVYGLSDKEIWLNETNAAPSQDPIEPPHFRELPFEVTLSEQSAFMIQIYAMSFAAGLERVQQYKLTNSTDHPEDVRPFGLVRGDQSRRPAFAAYQVVIRYLSGFEEVALYRQAGVTLLIFKRDDEAITIVWNETPTPRQVTIQAQADQAMLVDEAGHSEPLLAPNGAYHLDLPPAECSGGDCFIGGAPRLLVETPDSVSLNARFTVDVPAESPEASWINVMGQFNLSKRRLALGFGGLVLMSMIGVGGWWIIKCRPD